MKIMVTSDCKEIQSVHPKGNQSWIFIGRTDAETPILWPSDLKNWLIWKDPNAGKDWKQEEKGMTEDEMVGSHHWLNGHEFEQALGVGDGQGSLVCCSPWGQKESDTTEQLNWTETKFTNWKQQNGWINNNNKNLNYTWPIRDSLHLSGHTQTETEGIEKHISCKQKPKASWGCCAYILTQAIIRKVII